jgi:hypothetical protein
MVNTIENSIIYVKAVNMIACTMSMVVLMAVC